MKIWIAANARGHYAEGSITYGKPEHPAHDPRAATNPAVVVEVLSHSSGGDDEDIVDADRRLVLG